MNQLDMLELYLITHEFNFKRKDDDWRHQILVFDEYGDVDWDAVCHKGSYGYEEGLLEIMGSLVTEEERKYDSVVGWLTAEDVVKRLESK